MKSAVRAKRRLKADIVMPSPYEIRCGLEREIRALKEQRDTLQQQLIEAQASNANWRVQCGELINQNDDLRAQPVEADK